MKKILLFLLLSMVLIISILTSLDMKKSRIYYYGTNINKYKNFGEKPYDEKLWKENINLRREMLYSYLKEKKYESDYSYETNDYFPESQDNIKNMIKMGIINGEDTFLIINRNRCFQLIPKNRHKVKYGFYLLFFGMFNNIECDYTFGT